MGIEEYQNLYIVVSCWFSLVRILPRQPIDVNEVIRKAGMVHKLLGVKRDTYLDFNQFQVQLNMTADETVKFLIILSGVDIKGDLLKDERVRNALRIMGRGQ